MKRLLFFILSVLMIWSCGEILPEEQPMITLDPDQPAVMAVAAAGESFDIIFTSSMAWTTEVVYSDNDSGWIRLNKTEGDGGVTIAKVKVTVSKNELEKPRSAKLVIKSDTISEEISFIQEAAKVEPEPEPEPEPEVVFNLSDGTAQVAAEGGRVQVTVQYNVEYECTVSADWIREVETKSYNETVHVFEVDANTQTEARTTTITFCGNGKCIPFVVTQDAAEQEPDPGTDPDPEPEPEPDVVFSLSDDSEDISADGGAVELIVQHNIDYEYTIPVDWIHEVTTKNVEEDVHTFVVDRNTGTEPRSAVISFCGNGTCIPFVVNQAAGEPEAVFELSDNSAEVGAEGGIVDVTVTSNVEYDYSITVDWVTEVTTRTTIERTHTFEVAPNTGTESRTVTISFCGNDTCKPFTITQTGSEPDRYLNIDKTNVSVPVEGTSSPVTVNVISNTAWNVASDSDWCSVNPASGENDGSFNITVTENTSTSSRLATVTVSSATGAVAKTIAVVQSPVYQEQDEDSWKNAEFEHVSFAFRFTADWCGYCPQMATAMSNAQKELAGKFEVVSVHAGSSGLASDASSKLTNHYSILNFPTGLVDGRTTVDNNEISVTTSKILAAVKDTEDKYDVVTGTSWTSQVSGGQVVLNLSAYIKKSGSYKVTALLVEDKVYAFQKDYTNGDTDKYEHKGIIRAALSDALGEDFDVAEDGQVKNFTYSTALPSSCNVNNVRVVVYIQRRDTSMNSYYVDNSASAAVGKKKHLSVVSDSWSDGNEGIVPGDDITF